jgi:hypothetical protein
MEKDTLRKSEAPAVDWDFAPVKSAKPIDECKCQSIYWNLLLKLDKDVQIEPATFVALLAGTKRCDSIGEKNLSLVRKSYAETMNEWKAGSYERVLRNKDVELADKEAAYRTMEDYESWTANEISSVLSWKNYIVYHTWHRAERTFAAIGVIGSVFAGGKFLHQRKHLVVDFTNSLASKFKR